MFTDIADFTTLAASMDPESLTLHVLGYFEAMTEAIARHMGVVDKYIGDAMLVLWNAPQLDPRHAAHACAAALECRRLGEKLNSAWADQGLPRLQRRFGIHTGQVVVGNIGGAERINYTANGGWRERRLPSRGIEQCVRYAGPRLRRGAGAGR
jgi:adenylate cyclase